jgi:uncharacterized protein DUF1553/uncharacterized protein DUF1549/cytochrome c/concanavalin A-like lectin/glucanase superfamily protein
MAAILRIVVKLSLLLLLAPSTCRAADSAQLAKVSFNRDVRPILAQNCLVCHGRDANHRQAGLRLDTFEGATADRDGSRGIVPGEISRSALWQRITSADPDVVMPPPHSGKPPLSVQQRAILKTWIEQGAPYERHWAFAPLPSGTAWHWPQMDEDEAAANPIDAFVAAKLQEHGLRLAPQADHAALIRRVALDLTGLPPSSELLALPYEEAVDRLLASPHFGEHMAAGWLDAARYADTNGYFSDKPRQMWLWRDWVIDAFNANMSYDRFTIEQVAGDLLPNATVKQRIATGFNRNHMANNETGSIDEEFRVEYVVDRVSTTMTTWLGLTAGCAQCHDHKYDPLSQREFYQLFAFFNQVPEQGVIVADNPPPLISVPSPQQERSLQEAAAESRDAAAAFGSLKEQVLAQLSQWEVKAASSLPLSPRETIFHEAFSGSPGPDVKPVGTSLAYEAGVRGEAAKFDATQHLETSLPELDLDRAWTIGMWVSAEGSLSCPLSLIEAEGDRRGIEILWQKGRVQVNLVHRWGESAIEVSTVEAQAAKQWHQIVVSYDGSRKAAGLRVFFDGQATTLEVKRDTLSGTLANRQLLRIGRRDSGLGFYGLIDEVRIVRQAVDENDVRDWFFGERVRGILETPAAKRSAADADELLDYYIDHFADEPTQQLRRRVKRAADAEKALRESIPTVLVMQELDEPRATHVLVRGQYDQPGEIVTPDVPAAIAPWPEGAPRNRLGLAQWLVSKENPLTPRVAVNRLWQQCFGEGLVRTVEDFGTQGEPPTHPELLDWLAVTFRDSGWDVKGMLRRIVLSRTYRQQSAVRHKSDPDNRLLARGPSRRLSAEMLRDQALAASGLLVRKIGGPSVKPQQPPGLWEVVSYNAEESYVADTGDGQWRRSLYTFVKRQAPPPALLIFDGPTREKCTVRRARTSTPLQALVLLNDPIFVEASRMLAARAMASPGDDTKNLHELWRRVLVRDAQDDELALLHGLLARQRERFAKSPAEAQQLLAVGSARRDAGLDPRELAAWTVVAQAVLNLDEAITQR